jgi:hypothetical protein
MSGRPPSPQQGIVERAYQLASSGSYSGLGAIRAQLRADGYSRMQVAQNLEGTAIRQALAKLCLAARKDA